jgi:hypothetical protein
VCACKRVLTPVPTDERNGLSGSNYTHETNGNEPRLVIEDCPLDLTRAFVPALDGKDAHEYATAIKGIQSRLGTTGRARQRCDSICGRSVRRAFVTRRDGEDQVPGQGT